MVDAAPMKYFMAITEMLETDTFKNGRYEMFTRTENGKTREIFKLPYYPDRIIHHAIMNILEPIWMRVFIRDTYSTMKGRGIHDGARRIRKFLMDDAGTRYCLKFDVKKFYPSIDHGILKSIIRRSIKCRATLALLDKIIDSAPGVPIGNYLSQYFANLYLAYFDHWAKESIGAKYYSRYCDDIVILHSDKAVLHCLKNQVSEYFSKNLKLKMKENWQVFPVDIRGIDFLGYRFFRKYTLVRKRIAAKFIRKARKVRTGKVKTFNSAVSPIMSYCGWLKHANARNLWISCVDGALRHRVDAITKITNQRNPLRRMS